MVTIKYKLIGNNDYIFDPIGTVLKNRGVKDVDKFLNLDESVCIPYSKLSNIDKAVKCLVEHIEKKSTIFIIVDSDADGYTSASILYQYLKLIDPHLNILWQVQKGKEHGLANIDIPKDVNLVIVPDAGSNDFQKHEELFYNGIDVIVLDHHEIERESEYAIVVNSQLGDYDNLNLSGAGIVYKFCKALDDVYWVDYADYFLDLVALGNISDSMSMKELETRYLVNQGLNNIENEFFKALIKQQEFSTKGQVNITNVMFYITPLINATIRFGSIEDKEDMFRAFINETKLVKYKPRGSDEIYEPFVVNMARRCYNLRNRQSKSNSKMVDVLIEKIDSEQLDSNQVIVINANELLNDSNLSGLVANQLASRYKKPTIIFSKLKDGILTGSARGYDKSDLKDFKQIVLETGFFEYAVGHANAYGVGIKVDNLSSAIMALNEKLKEYNFEEIYQIDFLIPFSSMNEELIYTIAQYKNIWGKDIEEPMILVENIPIDKDNIYLLGKNEDTIKILNSGITYIFFKRNKEDFVEIHSKEFINLIGRASINEYEGNIYPQIIVDAYELR